MKKGGEENIVKVIRAAVSEIRVLRHQLSLAVDALTSIAAPHLGKLRPEMFAGDASQVVITDTEIAREALAQIKSNGPYKPRKRQSSPRGGEE